MMLPIQKVYVSSFHEDNSAEIKVPIVGLLLSSVY